MIPIVYSHVPDLYPNDYLVKYGILELMGSVGIIIGAPIATFLYNFFSFFWVFAGFGIFNLVCGTMIILAIYYNQSISAAQEESRALPFIKTFFSPGITLNFLYLAIFAIPNYMILSGLEEYVTTLSNNLNITAVVYSSIFVGLLLGVLFIQFFYVEKHKFTIVFISGLIEIAFLSFYGPEPLYGIEDPHLKLILIAVSFLICGIMGDIIFLIMTDILLNELLKLYPQEAKFVQRFF